MARLKDELSEFIKNEMKKLRTDIKRSITLALKPIKKEVEEIKKQVIPPDRLETIVRETTRNEVLRVVPQLVQSQHTSAPQVVFVGENPSIKAFERYPPERFFLAGDNETIVNAAFGQPLTAVSLTPYSDIVFLYSPGSKRAVKYINHPDTAIREIFETIKNRREEIIDIAQDYPVGVGVPEEHITELYKTVRKKSMREKAKWLVDYILKKRGEPAEKWVWALYYILNPLVNMILRNRGPGWKTLMALHILGFLSGGVIEGKRGITG